MFAEKSLWSPCSSPRCPAEERSCAPTPTARPSTRESTRSDGRVDVIGVDAVTEDVPDAPLVCASDRDCAADRPRCDTATGVCVPCLADPDCPSGQRCVGNACRLACGRGAPCTNPGELCCGGACAPVLMDNSNCGACGVTCPGGTRCESGMCCASGCPGGCGPGQTCCAGECVDLRASANNFGACGRVCLSGQGCLNGMCVGCGPCPAGQSCCSGMCADLLSDRRNCGMCGLACAAGQACIAGRCAGCGACTPGARAARGPAWTPRPIPPTAARVEFGAAPARCAPWVAARRSRVRAMRAGEHRQRGRVRTDGEPHVPHAGAAQFHDDPRSRGCRRLRRWRRSRCSDARSSRHRRCAHRRHDRPLGRTRNAEHRRLSNDSRRPRRKWRGVIAKRGDIAERLPSSQLR